MARMGSARTFFEVVGSFQANRLIKDTKAAMVVSSAIVLDAVGGVIEAIEDMFDGVTDLIDEQMTAFYAYEEELIRVKKFYQGAAEEVEYYEESSKRLGETFAFTGAEALKAAAQMAQMKTVLGESAAVIAGAEMGLLFAEIGGMDTQMAMKRLTSLMQQTGFALGGMTNETYRNLDAETQANVVRSNTIRVLDQLNTIENSSVATMEDMTFVLNQFASQATLAGESMGDMASLAALLLEAGEESSRAGTGLRMMYSRLAVEGGEASEALAAAIPELDAQTIAQMNLTDVIRALAPHYETMTDLERIRLTQAVAGNRHYVKLQKLIVNHTRLIELQGMAYTGAFGALDEFANRQESELYQYDRAQAILENLRVEIGQNLADAYVRALQPQERFLNMMKTLSAKDGSGQALLANIMMMDSIIATFKLPLDFAMGLINTIISMQVLNVVLRSVSDSGTIAQNSFAAAAQTQEFLAQQTLQTVTFTKLQGEQVVASGLKQMQTQRALAASKGAQIARERTSFNESALRVTALMELEKEATGAKQLQIQAEIDAEQTIQAQQNEKIVKLEEERMKQEQLFQASKNRYNLIKSQESGIQPLLERSAKLKHEQIDASRTFSYHLRKENRMLRDEFLVLKPLSTARKDAIKTQLQSITTKMTEHSVAIAGYRDKITDIRLSDKSQKQKQKEIGEIRKLIQAEKKRFNQLSQGREELEMVIFAERQYQERLQVSTQTIWQRSTAQWRGNGIMKNSIALAKSSMWAFTGLNSILMMTADTEAEMYAGMMTMAAGFAVVKIAAYMSSAAVKDMAISAIIAKGAITGFVGLVAGLAAYTVSKSIAERFVGDESDLMTIVQIENSVANIYGYANELANMGEEAVNPLMGDATWNDLRRDADLTEKMLDDMATKRNEIHTMIETGEGTLTEFELQELQARLSQLETHYGSVETLHNAHLTKMKQDSWEAMLEEAAMANTAVERQEVMGTVGLAGVGVAGYRWTDSGGRILKEILAEQYSSVEEYQEAIDYWTDSMDNYVTAQRAKFIRDNAAAYAAGEASIQSYADSLLLIRSEEEAYQNTVIAGNTRMLESMEAFTDAREELFFGERANFTGALYKQITQGGVENLLHKTEILQTNNFYGLTLDETIEKVTVGVLQEIENRTG